MKDIISSRKADAYFGAIPIWFSIYLLFNTATSFGTSMLYWTINLRDVEGFEIPWIHANEAKSSQAIT